VIPTPDAQGNNLGCHEVVRLAMTTAARSPAHVNVIFRLPPSIVRPGGFKNAQKT
jgi:hypothetical protein